MKEIIIGLLVMILTFSVLAEETQQFQIDNKIKTSRRAYLEARKFNPQEITDFKKAVKKLKSELASNMSLAKNLKEAIISGSNVEEVLADYIPSTASSNIFRCDSTAYYDKNKSNDHHVLVYGVKRCKENYNMVTIGPGLWSQSIGSSVFICALPRTSLGVNAGASAKAGFLLGLTVGTLFGENGVCVELGVGFGFGAAAGLSVIYPIVDNSKY